MISILFWFLLVLFGTNESKFLSNRGKSKKNRKNHGKGPVKGIDDDDISLNDFIKKGVKKRGKSDNGHNVNKEKLCQYYKNIPIYGACIVMEYEEDDNNDEDGYVDFGVYYDKKELRKHIKNTKSKLSDADIKDIISNDLGDSYTGQDFTFNCDKWIYHIDDIPYFVLMCIVNGDEESGQLIIPDGDTDDTSLYYEYVIDAKTGKILQKTNLLHSATSVTDIKIGNDGTLGLLDITEQTSWDNLYHTGYNLAVQDCNHTNDSCTWLHCSSTLDCEPGSEDTNGGYGIALLAYHYAVKTYECFNAYLGEDPVTLGETLPVRVHYRKSYQNAFWNGASITFGDGGSILYPLVCMDVMAHELAHGYTTAKSNLQYEHESGGMNEAFSDLAGKACEKYERGSFEWGIGGEIFKQSGEAVRYMNNPPQDGESIDHYSNYYDDLDVHYSSGVYNKAFYLMTQYGLDITDVFKIAGTANVLYWTTQSTMSQGAEGMILAANDLGLNVQAVKKAFIDVGVIELDIVLVKDGAECASEIKNLGSIITPQQCAVAAARDHQCSTGNQFMFSDNYPSWGCRCCPTSYQYGGDNANWDVYRFAENLDTVLVKDGAGCASELKNLGNIATAKECAVMAATDTACSGNQFMFSDNYRYAWGCRCCPASTTYGSANSNWDVYEYSNVVLVNSAEAETDINLLNDITNDNHEQNGEELFMKRFIYPDYTYFIPIIGITLIINFGIMFMVYHFCIKPKFKNHSYDLVDQAKDIQVVH